MNATYITYKGFKVQKRWGCSRNEYHYTVLRTNQTFQNLKDTKQHINAELTK